VLVFADISLTQRETFAFIFCHREKKKKRKMMDIKIPFSFFPPPFSVCGCWTRLITDVEMINFYGHIIYVEIRTVKSWRPLKAARFSPPPSLAGVLKLRFVRATFYEKYNINDISSDAFDNQEAGVVILTS